MATTSLIENFQSLDVADDADGDQPDPTCLPFNPGRDFDSVQEKLSRVDRYLFRLFDKHSDGSTNHVWVKSRDAENSRPTGDIDIFARDDRGAATQALRRHLQWHSQSDKEEDNFVSWTSSLLLVLQYAFYRSKRFGDIDFAKMFICVVDTSLLPDRVFINDMALIEAFAPYDPTKYKSLPGLKKLREREYYFGEYLSQGALRIEGCCSIASMRHIIDDGLAFLRPEFGRVEAFNGEWANGVITLRKAFDVSEIRYLAMDSEVDAALRIGKRYEPSWEVPIALAFLALKPRPNWDETIIKAFRKYNRGRLSAVLPRNGN